MNYSRPTCHVRKDKSRRTLRQSLHNSDCTWCYVLFYYARTGTNQSFIGPSFFFRKLLVWHLRPSKYSALCTTTKEVSSPGKIELSYVTRQNANVDILQHSKLIKTSIMFGACFLFLGPPDFALLGRQAEEKHDSSFFSSFSCRMHTQKV